MHLLSKQINYQQFNVQHGKGPDEFRPSEILDLDDGNDSDDEILKKFRDGPKKRSPPRKASRVYNINQGASTGAKPPYSEAGHLYGGSPSRLQQYKI